MSTETEIFKQVYMKPGIHVRMLSRELKVGMPSVKYALKKLYEKRLVNAEKEGRNVKLYVNYKNRLAVPYIYNVEYERLLSLPKKAQDAVFHVMDYLFAEPPVMVLVFGSYVSGDYTNASDLDILIVSNNGDGQRMEKVAKIVSSGHGIEIQPVYMTYKDLHRNFHGDFIQKVRENKIIVTGAEWWIKLERKGTWREMV